MARVIFFDLFETLITHFDPDWTPPPQTIAARLGISDDIYNASWPEFDRAWQAGQIATHGDALARLCAVAGNETVPDVVTELTREYEQEIARIYGSIESEIIAMVSTLKDSGFKLSIITNASDLDTAPWPGCALAPYFDDFVASHDVGLLKRDRRIFDLACERLGVEQADALFVGDGGGDELRGATEAGMDAYWCTWFLDLWPAGIRPNGFPGDDWRQSATPAAPPYPRLARPSDVIDVARQ